MQVSWHHSLRFKLFMLMAVFLLLIAGAVSGKNIFDFQRILKDQLSEKVLGTAQSSLSAVETRVEAWRSQVGQTLQVLASGNSELLNANVKNLAEQDPNVLSFHLLSQNEEGKFSTEAYAFTGRDLAENFAGKNPEKIKKKIFAEELRWATRHKKRPNKSLYLNNPSKKVGIAVVQIWVPAITGDKTVNWGVLTVLQKSLAAVLPSDNTTKSALIDSSSRVLVSPTLKDVMRKRSFSKYAFVRKGVASKSTVRPQEFKASRGKLMIATYVYSKELQSGILVQRDPRLAYNEIKKQIANTALLSFVFLLLALLASYHASKGITKSLALLVDGTQRIANGDFRSKLRLTSADEIGFVSHAINYMSVQIENLMSSQIEAVRQEKELETAKAVQETLLPKDDRIIGPLAITGAYLPASECGGDWWGNFTTSDGKEFVCIADATGHGAAAALVTAMAFSSCMTMAKMHSESDQAEGPEAILKRLNDLMVNAGDGKLTMTFFAAFIDPVTGEMVYANAGHNFPYLIPMDAEDARLDKMRKKKKSTARALPLNLGGSPLGFEPGAEYKTKSLQLQAGDRLFLYTDGLIECTNANNEMYGKISLLKAIDYDHTPADLKESAINNAFTFFNGHPIDDDVTVVVVELDKEWVPQQKSTAA